MSYIILFFGLMPYSLTYNEREQNFTIVKKSWIKRLSLSICNVAFFTVFHFYHTYLYIAAQSHNETGYDFYSFFNYLLQGILGYSSCLTYYVEVYRHREASVAMLRALCAAWREARGEARRGAAPRGSETPGRMLLNVYVILLLLLLISSLRFTLLSITVKSQGSILLLFFKYAPLYLETISFVILAHIYVIMLLLVTTLMLMKETVLSVARQDGGPALSDAARAGRVVAALRPLRRAHASAHRCLALLNRCFQGTIILCFMQAFVTSIATMHIIFQDVLYNFTVLDWYNRVLTVVWFLFLLLKVYVLGHAGQLIEKEVSIHCYLHK